MDMKIHVTVNDRGEPEGECEDLVKAVNFHAGRCIPFVYKDGRDMPVIFISKVKEALDVHFDMGNIADDYIAGLVKSAWKEWTSRPSASCYSGTFPFLDSLDEDSFEELNDDLFSQWRTLIGGNEWGEPEHDEDLKNLVKTVNFHTRRHIPISHRDSRDLSHAVIQKVIDAVNVYFVFTEIDEDFICEYVKDAWRAMKIELRRKYIKNKDPATVKASSPSPFVSNEDWGHFVDLSTSTNNQATKKRNPNTDADPGRIEEGNNRSNAKKPKTMPGQV